MNIKLEKKPASLSPATKHVKPYNLMYELQQLNAVASSFAIPHAMRYRWLKKNADKLNTWQRDFYGTEMYGKQGWTQIFPPVYIKKHAVADSSHSRLDSMLKMRL